MFPIKLLVQLYRDESRIMKWQYIVQCIVDVLCLITFNTTCVKKSRHDFAIHTGQVLQSLEFSMESKFVTCVSWKLQGSYIR